jgi:diguanylate cyclase (GGDEF)-like protein
MQDEELEAAPRFRAADRDDAKPRYLVLAAFLVLIFAIGVAYQQLDSASSNDELRRLGNLVLLGFGALALFSLPALLHLSMSQTRTEIRLDERERDATHDELTGLLNRKGLIDRLKTLLEDRTDGVAVLFMDLDRFKNVNDSLGHAAGDELLQAVAERIRDAVRTSDEVARFGGDEFVVLCPNVSDLDAVVKVAEKVTRALAVPVELRGMDPVPGASIGIAIAEVGEEIDADSLMANADAAMYRAKGQGRSSYALFDTDLRNGALMRLETEGALRRAIENDELVMRYQPVFDAHRLDVVLVESLIRWDRPGFGVLRPGDFLPIAAEAGLMGDLGDWSLREVCAQVGRWRTDLGLSHPVPVAVNISASQLLEPTFVERVEGILDEFSIQPRDLTLDISENAVIADIEYSSGVLTDLAELGVQLAIDDYGTGMASLGYIKRLDMVRLVKIAPANFREIETSPADHAVVGAVISVARALNKGTIVEGVETEGQFSALRALGVDMAQGRLLGAPVEAGKLSDKLVERDVVLSARKLNPPETPAAPNVPFELVDRTGPRRTQLGRVQPQ